MAFGNGPIRSMSYIANGTGKIMDDSSSDGCLFLLLKSWHFRHFLTNCFASS